MSQRDMLFNMREHETPRNEASAAVIALRKALGMTQQRFAVETLKTAITTVARYETSHPPRGPVLLRLAEIAEQSGQLAYRDSAEGGGSAFIKLALVFQRLYIEEVIQNLGRTPLLQI